MVRNTSNNDDSNVDNSKNILTLLQPSFITISVVVIIHSLEKGREQHALVTYRRHSNIPSCCMPPKKQKSNKFLQYRQRMATSLTPPTEQLWLTSDILYISLQVGRCPPPKKNYPLHWGIQAPTQNVVPWAHPSPHPKWHHDWFSRFCTAYCSIQQTHTHNGTTVTTERILCFA